MTDFETALRAGLHDRLDDVDLPPGVLSAVPPRAARIRRRRAAVLAGAMSITLLAGISAAVYLPRGERDASSVDMVDDGTGEPAQSGLSRRAEDYARQLAAGDYAGVRAEMTDRAREVLTETRLKNVWRSVFGDRGASQIHAYLESSTGDRRVVAVHVGDIEPKATLYVVYENAESVGGLVLLAHTQDDTWSSQAVRAHGVLSQMRDGAFEAVRRDFDPTMLAELSEARLRSTWQQVIDTYGPVQVTGGHLEALTPTGHRVVDVVVHFREGVMKVRVAFDAEQRIAGLFVLVLDA